MSERWVINRLLKLQAVAIDWNEEAGALGYVGDILDTGMDPGFMQFRWLLHPLLGLPRQPFVLSRNRHPGGNPTTQELADLPDWEQIETIGLPVDGSWGDTGYDLSDQGPVDNPISPRDAAMRRLQLGAPRIGWTRVTLDGLPGGLPLGDGWKPPVLEAYLKDTQQSRLVKGIHDMLRARPNGLDHAVFVDREEDAANPARLNPRLLVDRGAGATGPNQPARSEWRPYGMLLVSAGTDSLAALALGFGTARNGEPDDLYMISVRHQIQVGGQVHEFELADVVSIDRRLRAPDLPTNLSTGRIGRNRPQVLDGPALETIGVTWDRPLNPIYSQLPVHTAFPASYVVGRFGPQSVQTELLLSPRPGDVHGWLPFTTSKPDEARPVLFTDHIVCASTLGGVMMADPRKLNCTYAVAAQDIFGRWGAWSKAPYEGADELPQTPAVLAVDLEPSGAVTIDFAWDWSDRSPEFIKLVGAFGDDPANRLLTVTLSFEGGAKPALGGAQVMPLNSDRSPAAGWGAPQDRNPAEPEVRFYRLTSIVAVTFAGRTDRFFQVQARGQCHIHKVRAPIGSEASFNISPFSKPVSTRIYDPVPPPPPTVPEAPQWASLRDVAGVSRILLRWSTNKDVAGYVLYEATETALLAALQLPGPDNAQSFVDRLAVLRAANLPALRSAFRRVQKELIPPGAVPETVYEVALPRGSTVLHFYAVTAMSHNNVESAWPDSSKKFIAVAAPRLVTPVAPSLEANVEAQPAQSVVSLRVGIGAGAAVSQVELYRLARDERPDSVDRMGPPLVTLNAGGPEVVFTDTTLTPSWRRVWYRAVSWSARDDLKGIVEARSAASSPASILIPPLSAPDVIDVLVNELGSTVNEALVSWSSHAPLSLTPFGPHVAIVEIRDTAAEPARVRIEARLDTLLSVSDRSAVPALDPNNPIIVQVPVGSGYRLYTWILRAADQTCHLTIKMIDPLGRIGTTALDVPPLDLVNPVLDQVVIPAWTTKAEVLEGDEMGLNVLSAVQLGLQVVFEFDQQHPGFGHEEVISISPPPGTVVNVGSTVTVLINLEG